MSRKILPPSSLQAIAEYYAMKQFRIYIYSFISKVSISEYFRISDLFLNNNYLYNHHANMHNPFFVRKRHIATLQPIRNSGCDGA